MSKIPNHRTIYSIYTKFKKTETVLNKERFGDHFIGYSQNMGNHDIFQGKLVYVNQKMCEYTICIIRLHFKLFAYQYHACIQVANASNILQRGLRTPNVNMQKDIKEN